MSIEQQIAFLIADPLNSGGAQAKCPCGYTATWRVSDGSAEADVHYHRMGHDSEYADQHNQTAQAFIKDLQSRGCTCQFHGDLDSRIVDHGCPLHKPTPSISWSCTHECTCFISAPCGKCENCQHPDITNCQNDCQDCEDHLGETR